MITAYLEVDNFKSTIFIQSADIYYQPNNQKPFLRLRYAFSQNNPDIGTYYIYETKTKPSSITLNNTKYTIDNNKSLLILYNNIINELTLDNI